MQKKNRRKFIKNLAFTTFSMSLLYPIKKIFSNERIPPWIELLEMAKWCPTIHNLQPQKLKIISAKEAHLYYDPKRLLPVGDPKSVFTTVAMGIFIEHLSIVAGYFGYQVKIVELFDDISIERSKITLFARLQLAPRKTTEEIKRNLILKRRTSRKNYNGEPIQSNLLKIIKDESAKFDNEFFHTTTDKSIKLIKKINQEALFDDLNNHLIRKELDNLFRYNKNDAEFKKDGLWSKCMGFSGKLLKSVFQKHEKWVKGINKVLLKETYIASFNGTTTVGWFGGDFKTKKDYLNCGQMMARCWLLITKEGAYIQPFGSLITNTEANKKINNLFTQPKADKEIWMIFRLGYSKKPARSYRLKTNDYIINS